MKIGTTFAISLVLWAFIWGGYLYFGEKELRGLVADELSGEPLPGAMVVLGESSIETDTQGGFLFSGPAGLFPITVSKPGYLPTQGEVEISGLLVKQVSVEVLLRPTQLALTLFDAQTGKQVTEAQVSAGEVLAESESNGGLILRRLAEGQTLIILAAGYLTQEMTYDGQEELRIPLQPQEVILILKDLYDGQSISGAVITWEGGEVISDENGLARIRLLDLESGASILAQSEGYAPLEMTYAGQETVEIYLRPTTLSGIIHDQGSGQPLFAVEILLGDQVIATSAADGSYTLQDLPAEASLVFRAPGYKTVEMPLPPARTLDVALQRVSLPLTPAQPTVAHGIYINLGFWFNPQKMWELLSLVERTELDALVVDIKGDSGRLVYPSNVPLAQESGAYLLPSLPVTEVLEWAQEHNIYTIARMVVFKDPALAVHHPDLAVHRGDGSLLADGGGALWVDPFREEVWQYNIDLAKEVAALGFDEIQFDYIRFPSDGPVRDAVYAQPSTPESRLEAIRGFMARAQEELKPLGVALSADVFAITAWVENDQGIGQMIENVAPYVDYLSPMVYPSTFTPGVGGYDIPTQYPYEIVYQTLARIRERSAVAIRPWLQHFSDYRYGVPYGLSEYLAQKQAALDAGATGWLFWNALGIYNEAAF
ncbi:MAG: hypothetical protein HYX86_06210 [Chloroflexi bacterium]|nr:hypothetical protein [Chloroflexota bacterium]